MYYLYEKDLDGHYEPNMTMYASSVSELMNRICPNGLWYRDWNGDPFSSNTPGMIYRIISPHLPIDKAVGIVYSSL